MAISEGDIVLLAGTAQNGAMELSFLAASGIRADFKVRGETGGREGLRLRGAGGLRLNGLPIDPASVEVTGAGITVSSTKWGERDCHLLFSLEPGARTWSGTVEIGEPVPCVVTSPATLSISLNVESPNAPGRDARCDLKVEMDDVTFELALEPSIVLFSASQFPRIRTAVLEEWKRRLLREISVLEAEMWRARLDDDTEESERRSAEARERTLRHAGWVTGSEPRTVPPPPPAEGRFQPVVIREQETSYLSAREVRSPAQSYLPMPEETGQLRIAAEGGYLARSSGPPRAASFGPGPYLPASSATSWQSQYAPPPPATRRTLAPTNPGSPAHRTAHRLLRCKDLLRALPAP